MRQRACVARAGHGLIIAKAVSMQVALHITLRGLSTSEALDAAIRKHAARLDRFHSRVTGCHVTVERPHQHHHKGGVYRVSVDVLIPGGNVIVSHEPGLNHAHEDVYVALRDAFDAAVRRVEDVLRRPRAERHPHEPALEGKVLRLHPNEGYGFLETDDGLEVYFHQNSVLGQEFEHLEVGDRVRVVVAESESRRGPQATTVERLR